MRILIANVNSELGFNSLQDSQAVGNYEPANFVYVYGGMYSFAITPFYPAMPFVINVRYKHTKFIIDKMGDHLWTIFTYCGNKNDTFITDDLHDVFKRLENGTIEEKFFDTGIGGW